jgi:DNA-binding NarL/FixJ family response regulator
VSSAPAAAKKVILVVDDSPLVLNATRLTLSEAGYEVITTDNPLTLPSVVRKHHIDLALIDLDMPAVTGDLVAEVLVKAGLASAKIVLFSDAKEDELRAKAIACGARGYLKKLGDQHLVKEVAKFLGG